MDIFAKTMISLSIKDALKFPDGQGLWEQGLGGGRGGCLSLLSATLTE